MLLFEPFLNVEEPKTAGSDKIFLMSGSRRSRRVCHALWWQVHAKRKDAMRNAWSYVERLGQWAAIFYLCSSRRGTIALQWRKGGTFKHGPIIHRHRNPSFHMVLHECLHIKHRSPSPHMQITPFHLAWIINDCSVGCKA